MVVVVVIVLLIRRTALKGEGVFAILIQYYSQIRMSVYSLDYLQN